MRYFLLSLFTLLSLQAFADIPSSESIRQTNPRILNFEECATEAKFLVNLLEQLDQELNSRIPLQTRENIILATLDRIRAFENQIYQLVIDKQIELEEYNKLSGLVHKSSGKFLSNYVQWVETARLAQ